MSSLSRRHWALAAVSAVGLHAGVLGAMALPPSSGGGGGAAGGGATDAGYAVTHLSLGEPTGAVAEPVSTATTDTVPADMPDPVNAAPLETPVHDAAMMTAAVPLTDMVANPSTPIAALPLDPQVADAVVAPPSTSTADAAVEAPVPTETVSSEPPPQVAAAQPIAAVESASTVVPMVAPVQEAPAPSDPASIDIVAADVTDGMLDVDTVEPTPAGDANLEPAPMAAEPLVDLNPTDQIDPTPETNLAPEMNFTLDTDPTLEPIEPDLVSSANLVSEPLLEPAQDAAMPTSSAEPVVPTQPSAVPETEPAIAALLPVDDVIAVETAVEVATEPPPATVDASRDVPVPPRPGRRPPPPVVPVAEPAAQPVVVAAVDRTPVVDPLPDTVTDVIPDVPPSADAGAPEPPPAASSGDGMTDGGSGADDVAGDGSGGDGSSGASEGEINDYLHRLQAWLVSHRDYPRRARSRRQEGIAHLYFVMDRNGHVLEAHLQQSTGYELLDREVLAMIERAQPLPAMPDSMDQPRLELVVPIAFALR